MIAINGTPVRFEKFPNGETILPEEIATQGQKYDACPLITLKYESDEDLLHLYFVRSLFPQARLRIRYMPYSRMDRPASGFAFTLKDVTRYINAMGFANVIVEEPHSDVTCALLDRSAPEYVTMELLPKVWSRLNLSENDFLVFPDTQAQKRYAAVDPGEHKTAVCVRLGELVSLVTDDYGTELPQALIVDDLFPKGDMTPVVKALHYQMGFERVHLLVTHFEPRIKGSFNFLSSLWCTDSMLGGNLQDFVESHPKVHIFSGGHWVSSGEE